jgi:drug/metabolite transporter (DMT)-like permease
MSKNFQSHYSPIHITYTMTLTAMCITAPFAFVDIVTHSYLSQIHIRHVVALITSGAVGTVAFYMCYQYAIKYIGPHAASLMTYIQPIFAIFLSIILVGDVITPLFVLGGICAVGGAYIIVK